MDEGKVFVREREKERSERARERQRERDCVCVREGVKYTTKIRTITQMMCL